jgi:hypothetical protein
MLMPCAEGAVVTSTTINLVREFANYMALMHSLRPIAYDVFVGMTHLYEYYVSATG